MSAVPVPLHLTFDDGPDPEGTPRVLEALAEHDALATFFVLGTSVRKSPDLIAEILDAGHRVELHGDAHLDHRHATAQELVFDTGLAIRALADVGVTPEWWRLPWGRPGKATDPLAAGLGLRVVGWDIDTHDWRGDDWDDQPVELVERARRGGVVLMHDGIGPGATREPVDNTISLIHGFARIAASEGLTISTLPSPTSPTAFGITAQPGAYADVRAQGPVHA